MIFMNVEGAGDRRWPYSLSFDAAEVACNAANELMNTRGCIITMISTETGKVAIAENGGGITGMYCVFGVSQENRRWK